MTDAPGNPPDFILTGGQLADVTQAHTLVEGVKAEYALLDKAYDCDKLIEQLGTQGIVPVIPPKANRKQPREYDKDIYKERSLIECFTANSSNSVVSFYGSKSGRKITCILFVSMSTQPSNPSISCKDRKSVV